MGFTLQDAYIFTWKNLKEEILGRGNCVNESREYENTICVQYCMQGPMRLEWRLLGEEVTDES